MVKFLLIKIIISKHKDNIHHNLYIFLINDKEECYRKKLLALRLSIERHFYIKKKKLNC